MGRNVVKFGSLGIVALIVGRMTLNAVVAYWKATHPAPPPPPTVGFGILPKLRFPEQTNNQRPSAYTLETSNGSFPAFGDRAKVFLVQRSSPSLLADENAKAFAAAYNFVFKPETLGTDTYRWSKSQPLLATLELNINTYHFSLTTNYLSKPELVVNSTVPSGIESVTRVKTFLEKTKLLPRDIATGSGEVVYLKSLGGELGGAVSESDADFIQVDLNRQPIDNRYRMFTPEGYTGVVSAIVIGGLPDQDSIVQLKYNYNQVDYTQVHTYPIRTPQSAWQLLQAGEGYVVHKGNGDKATVRSVQLAYYDDFEEQDYLQPMYVFEGDGEFLAYVPAVDAQFIQK